MTPEEKKSIDERFEHISKSILTKDEIEHLIHEAMLRSLKDLGMTTKGILITVATVFGAIAIIGGGLKVVLGWLGFYHVAEAITTLSRR